MGIGAHEAEPLLCYVHAWCVRLSCMAFVEPLWEESRPIPVKIEAPAHSSLALETRPTTGP